MGSTAGGRPRGRPPCAGRRNNRPSPIWLLGEKAESLTRRALQGLQTQRRKNTRLMAENVPNLPKNTSLQIQEVEGTQTVKSREIHQKLHHSQSCKSYSQPKRTLTLCGESSGASGFLLMHRWGQRRGYDACECWKGRTMSSEAYVQQENILQECGEIQTFSQEGKPPEFVTSRPALKNGSSKFSKQKGNNTRQSLATTERQTEVTKHG